MYVCKYARNKFIHSFILKRVGQFTHPLSDQLMTFYTKVNNPYLKERWKQIPATFSAREISARTHHYYLDVKKLIFCQNLITWQFHCEIVSIFNNVLVLCHYILFDISGHSREISWTSSKSNQKLINILRKNVFRAKNRHRRENFFTYLRFKFLLYVLY